MYDCIDFSKEAYYVLQTSPFIYKHIKVTLSVSSRDKEVDLKRQCYCEYAGIERNHC